MVQRLCLEELEGAGPQLSLRVLMRQPITGQRARASVGCQYCANDVSGPLRAASHGGQSDIPILGRRRCTHTHKDNPSAVVRPANRYVLISTIPSPEALDLDRLLLSHCNVTPVLGQAGLAQNNYFPAKSGANALQQRFMERASIT